MPTASNLGDWATCADPASPTCSLPCWEIRPAIRPARHKEQLDEYSIQCYARVLRLAENRARGPVGDSATVLVGEAGVVGEPFHLYRAAGRRRRHLVRFFDRHHRSCLLYDRPC